MDSEIKEYIPTTLWHALLAEVTRMKRDEYGTSSNDRTVTDEENYAHPKVVKFHNEIVVCTGGIENVSINGLKTKVRISEITKDDLSMLKKFSNIVSFEISYCGLRSIKRFPQFLRLQKLDLTGNVLTNLDGLPNLPTLEELNLWGNKLENLNDLPSLPSLKSLIVSNNQLDDNVDLTVLSVRCPQLKQLFIGKNKFEYVESLLALQYLKELKLLYLEDNPFVERLSRDNIPKFSPNLYMTLLKSARDNDESWVHIFTPEKQPKISQEEQKRQPEINLPTKTTEPTIEKQSKNKANFTNIPKIPPAPQGLSNTSWGTTINWLEQFITNTNNTTRNKPRM